MADDQYADLLTQSRIQALERRLLALEKLMYYPNLSSAAEQQTQIKSQAAQAQATEHLPIKSDVRAVVELSAFVRDIANGKYYGDAHGVKYAAGKLLEDLTK